MKLNLVFICLSILVSGIDASEWEYSGSTGPDKWPEMQPICGHSSQSPINIKTTEVYPNPDLGLLHLEGYSQNLTGGVVENNGHTVQVNLPSGKTFTMSGKGIDGKYTALQMHFHWVGGNSHSGGSEHTIDGRAYQAEMHIVHIKNPFKSLSEVKDVSDGLAVIGVFLKANKDTAANPFFQKVLDSISDCPFKGDTVKLKNGPSLLSLLPDSASYFRYYGSLTTPPCYESVMWSVCKEPVSISLKQLETFQNLTKIARPSNITGSPPSRETPEEVDHENAASNHVTPDEQIHMNNNYRPVQPLNGRIVSGFYDIGMSDDEVDHEEWGYDGEKGPSHWPVEYPVCSGAHQSPVDFSLCNASVTSELKKISFSPSYANTTSGLIINNGHTIKYSLESGSESGIQFWETDKKFKALQIHFHWGSASVKDKTVTSVGGSEHTVARHHYPIEMHIVHEKMVKDNNTADNYAVLGVFFEIAKDKDVVSNRTMEAFGKLTRNFPKIAYHGGEVRLDQGPILSDFFPMNKSYYRYLGSLTTPPCTEAVMWTVFTHPVLITRDKFLEFQTLMRVKRSDVIVMNSTSSLAGKNYIDRADVLEKVELSNNYRPVQACGAREFQIYVEDDDKAVLTPSVDIPSIVVWTVLGLIVFCSILTMMICCRKKNKKEDRRTIYKQVSTHPSRDDAV